MPLFSANISTLFCEVPLIERIGLAAAAGFDAIEIQSPYDQDPTVLRAELELHKLPLVLMNFPVSDLMTGGEGLAAIPGREVEFELALSEARKFAELLRPRAINLLAGRPDARYDRAQCQAVFESNLRKAGSLTREMGMQLLTEPVNTIDLPGFFLSTTQQALDLIDTIPDFGLRMQYDLYHMQMMGEDPLTTLPAIIDRVGHIQFSDLPGRTEPGLGSIDFETIFKLIDSLGYKGHVGAEYFPTMATSATLGWLKPYR